MSTTTITVDTSGLKPWKDLNEREIHKAAAWAGRDGIRDAKVTGSRKIRESKSMKVADVNKALVIDPTTKDVLFWRLRTPILAMPVFAFKPRQTRKGITVTINKGSRAVIPHAFIARMKSGHEGVFIRHGAGTRVATSRWKGYAKYAGKKRQPIKELYTTRISDAFADAVPAMSERAMTSFRQTFRRVIATKATRGKA